MKLKYNFVMNEIADKTVAVAIGGDFKGILKMNVTGAYIFKMLQNDVTEDEIVAAMEKEFEGATAEEIRETVNAFIADLKKSDVLE